MAFFSSSLLSSPPLRCCCYLPPLPPRSRYVLTSRRASLRRSRLSLSKARSWRCRASSSGPPPPPLGNDPDGLQTRLSKLQDRVQIFLAVLFWMSLFFWGSAWDGRDNSRNKKGPRFRK